MSISRRGFLLASFAPSPPPNIVFILTDDLGLADLGCYGAGDIRTPAIDRLASQGVRFTQCYSNGPLCSPTRAALMTGRYQQRYGIEYAWTPRDAGKGLPATITTLPKLLRGAGYRTALVGKWHLGGDPEFSPLAHGFDEFFGLLGSDHDYYSHRRLDGQADLWDGAQPIEAPGYSTDLFTGRAVNFLERQTKAQPFFLYAAFNAPHWPFQVPDRPADVRQRPTWYDGTRQDYIDMVERLDQGVGRILEALERGGHAGNTLVVFTNDNGGERLSNNTPAFHQKMTLWEGGVRVPAILRLPGRVRPRTETAQVAITMDFTATLLRAAGVSADGLEGIDLLPILTGVAPLRERTLFWRYTHTPLLQKSVRQGRWKYLLDGIHEMLFDLVADPSEHTNLAYRHPQKVRELRALVRGWEADVDASAPAHLIR